MNKMNNPTISIVHWFPDLEKHKCGYCKQSDTNCSYGMWAETLTVEDYQCLIDRGWRRSGKYCYKPAMNITCCPLYTIRCEALNLKLSKSQKKIIKRVNRYVSESVTEKNCDDSPGDGEDMILDPIQREKPATNINIDNINDEQINLIIKNKSNNALASNDDGDNIYKPEQPQLESTPPMCSKQEEKCKPGIGADPSKPPCKKAKLLRFERKQQKLASKGMVTPQPTYSNNQEKSLEDFIEDISQTPAHKLKVTLVLTSRKRKDYSDIISQEYAVYRKYQMTIHGDPKEKCTEKQFKNFLLETPLQIVLKQMHPKEPTYKKSCELFAKYQMYVHNEQPDECDSETFKDFLVDSPLQHSRPFDSPEEGFGSFHQQYWLDDKLIAVGVIDILPRCISSVYFFYDPDYRNLTLGTYGSLRELYYVRQLNKNFCTIKYYYMGFYIHSCQKMRYKAKLTPSYLLCPETYVWFPVEHCLPKLDKAKYCRFNDNPEAKDRNACRHLGDLEFLMILIKYNGFVPFKYLRTRTDNDDSLIRFGNLVGKTCIPNLTVVGKNMKF